MKRVFWLFAALLALVSLGSAQESRGTIQGTVKDPQGGLIAGANVIVTNVETQTAATTKSNEAGRFTVPLLMPGNYTVTVDAAGFKREVRQGIQLLTADVRNLEVTLQIGASTETVTVSAEAPLI